MRTSFAAVAATVAVMAASSAHAATVHATDVFVDVENGANQTTSDGQRFGPTNALGAANGDFYSLGLGGSALFTFGTDILGPGTVVEVTFGCEQQEGTCSYSETAALYGVTGPLTLVEDGFVGSTGERNYDLSGLTTTLIANIPNGAAQAGFHFDTGGNTFAGLLLVDTSSNGGDGFDVASIAATPAPAPVPVPPAAALMVGALGGFGVLRRRKG